MEDLVIQRPGPDIHPLFAKTFSKTPDFEAVSGTDLAISSNQPFLADRDEIWQSQNSRFYSFFQRRDHILGRNINPCRHR